MNNKFVAGVIIPVIQIGCFISLYAFYKKSTVISYVFFCALFALAVLREALGGASKKEVHFQGIVASIFCLCSIGMVFTIPTPLKILLIIIDAMTIVVFIAHTIINIKRRNKNIEN